MTSLLRLPAVIKVTGLSRASVYSYAKKGLLPRSVKIGDRSAAWPESELDQINSARIAGKSEDQIRALVLLLEQQRHTSD